MKTNYSFSCLLSFLAFLMFSSSNAQIVIEPSPIYVDGVQATVFEGVGYSFAINNSVEGGTYTWQRNVIAITEGWLTAVCDKNLCYLSSTGQASFFLAPGESGTMDVHVYPNGFDGAAIIEILLTNDSDPNDSYEAIYYFNQTLSTPERLTNKFKVYPNPAVENFVVEGDSNVDRLEVFDVTGKVVFSAKGARTNTYNIADLKTGAYIVKFYDADSNVLSTNVLVKE